MENNEIERLKKELEKERMKNVELSSRIVELEDEKDEIKDNLNFFLSASHSVVV